MLHLSRMLIAYLWAVACLLACPALAQTYYPSAVPDQAASTTANYHRFQHNTGTDVIHYGNDEIQLMTWDDLDPTTGRSVVYLAASVNGAAPTQALRAGKFLGYSNPSLSDPDAVMADIYGLYANAVYLVTYVDRATGLTVTQTHYEQFQYDPGTQAFKQTGPAPVALGLGLTTNPTVNRRHSSPNIDANSRGFVAVTWQETSTERGYVTSTFPSYTQTSPVNTTFSNVYVVSGTIDGGIPQYVCPYWRGGRVVAVNSVDVANQLFNTNTYPDVALSNYNGTAVSVSFINTFATTVDVPERGTPTDDDYAPATTEVRTTTQLVVNQYEPFCNNRAPEGSNPEAWSPGLVVPSGFAVTPFMQPFAHMEWQDGVSNRPTRIASSNNPDINFHYDVEVVLGWEAYDCAVGAGPVVYREIHNWGRSLDPATGVSAFRPKFTVVSPPYDPRASTTPTSLPVVAYLDKQDVGASPYVITWMAKNYPQQGKGFDIWSRAFNAGVPVGNPMGYTRINGLEDSGVDGDQWAPSVAARNSGSPTITAHCFNDDKGQQIGFKALRQVPGSGPAQRLASAVSSEPAPTGTLQAYPNPFSNNVSFNLGLRPDEQVQRLVVIDLLGRVVETVVVSAAESRQQRLEWVPKQQLATGTYQVRMVTNQRTQTLRLNKR